MPPSQTGNPAATNHDIILFIGLLGEIRAEADMPEDERQILRYCLEWCDDYQGDVPPADYVAEALGTPFLKTTLYMLNHANFLKSYARKVAEKMRPCCFHPQGHFKSISPN